MNLQPKPRPSLKIPSRILGIDKVCNFDYDLLSLNLTSKIFGRSSRQLARASGLMEAKVFAARNFGEQDASEHQEIISRASINPSLVEPFIFRCKELSAPFSPKCGSTFIFDSTPGQRIDPTLVSDALSSHDDVEHRFAHLPSRRRSDLPFSFFCSFLSPGLRIEKRGWVHYAG